jgi:hypothetical protein
VTEPERTFSRAGLGYILRVEDLSLEMQLAYLKRRSGELRGFLTIKCNFMGVKTVDGVLHAADFIVSSSAARVSLAKTLHVRTPGFENFDWHIFLEELCQRTMSAETKGEPPMEIGFQTVESDQFRYAVDPIMARGVPSQLYGPGGSLKSCITQAVFVSIAAHRELIPGIPPAISGPVLYLDWETNWRTVNARVQMICRGAGIDMPHGFHYRRMFHRLAEEADEIAAYVEQGGYVAVAIDSAAYAIGGQGEHTGAEDGALRFHEAIRYFGDRVSTLFINHVPGAEISGPLNGHARKPYGSVFLINGARLNWELRKEAQLPDGRRLLKLLDLKPNDFAVHPPIHIAVDWTADSIGFAASSAEAAVAPEAAGTLADRIAELVEGSRMSAADIARYLSANPESVRVTLYRDKRFERDGSMWSVTPVTSNL